MGKKYKIFKSGIENKDYFEKKYNIKKASVLKYFIWLSALILLSSKKIINVCKKIEIIYSPLQNKILVDEDKYESVYTGQYINSIKILMRENTIVSYLNHIDRIKILLKSMSQGRKVKLNKDEFLFWIEYCFLYEYIKNNDIDEIFIAGHFDRYATWISYICKEENIYLKITQHGAVDYIELPNKIYCNELYVFNKYEAKVMKEVILNRETCKVIEKGFKSSIKFQSLNKSDELVIAIASQDALSKLTLELIEDIEYRFKNRKFKLVVYPHYREKSDKYKFLLEKFNNLYIEEFKRYNNVDLLITYYSTIVYDYLDFDTKIICLSPQNINMSFFNHEKVKVYREKEDLYNEISNTFIEFL